MPTYQRPALLLNAIESIRRQSYGDLEIVVVDDGSRDETEAVVRGIRDNRLRYLRHPANRGVPAVARNTGIAAARGEYIAFLDDDDEWHAQKLEKQLPHTRQHDAVLCGALINGRTVRVLSRGRIELSDLRRIIPDPSALLVRADVIKEMLFDENLRHGEDWDLFIRLAERGPIGYVPEPLLFYNDGRHRRLTNESATASTSALERRAAVLYKHRELFGERWFTFHFASTLLGYLGRRKERWSAIRYAVQRCGLMAVAAVLTDKVWRHFKTKAVERLRVARQ